MKVELDKSRDNMGEAVLLMFACICWLSQKKYAKSMQMKKGLKLKSSETLIWLAPPPRLERGTL